MLEKSHRQKVCNLLTEAVSMLCRSSLPYQKNINIEGLLGVTLDEKDIVLISIQEIVSQSSNDKTEKNDGEKGLDSNDTETSSTHQPNPKNQTSREPRRRNTDSEEEMDRERSSLNSSETSDYSDVIIKKEKVESNSGHCEYTISQVNKRTYAEDEFIPSKIPKHGSRHLETTPHYDSTLISAAQQSVSALEAMEKSMEKSIDSLSSSVSSNQPCYSEHDIPISLYPTNVDLSAEDGHLDPEASHSLDNVEITAKLEPPDSLSTSSVSRSSRPSLTSSSSSMFPFKCSVCGKQFQSFRVMMEHQQVHKGKYVCNFCGKKMCTQQGLQHICEVLPPSLAGEKKHVCKICGKSLNTQNGLQVHERTHTGERPYVCPGCYKGFTDRSNLKRHAKLCVHFHSAK